MDISSVQAFSFTAPGKEMAMNIRKSHLLASNRNNGSVLLRIICRYFAEYRSFPLENS